nr:flagellar biosynthetic protein FliR [Candidatus Hamiltonella defensa]
MTELVIGITIGFFATLPFEAIEMATSLINTMHGATMVSAINPNMGMQFSVFGILFSQVLAVQFLISVGFNSLLRVIYGSYDLLYPGEKILFLERNYLAFIKMQ